VHMQEKLCKKMSCKIVWNLIVPQQFPICGQKSIIQMSGKVGVLKILHLQYFPLWTLFEIEHRDGVFL
jgi:hypothetical protein